MQQLAAAAFKDRELVPTIEIDLAIKLEEVTWELFESLEQFAPFGPENPKPLFLSTNVSVSGAQTVGQDNKHLRLMVNDMTPEIRKTIGFRLGSWFSKIKKGDKVDLVFEIDLNEWNGSRELQLKIVDLRLSDAT